MAVGNRRRSRTKEVVALVKQVEQTGISVGEASSFDYQDLQLAINNASSGDKIHLDKGTYVGNIVINKNIFIQGSGSDTVINGTVSLQSGSSGSMLKNVKFADDVTVDNLVKNVNISDCWIASGKVLTDNNVSSADSLYLLIEEV